MPKPIQLDKPNSAIMYKQQIKPSKGINDKFCLNAQIANQKHTKIKIHIGILCLNKFHPLSYFKDSLTGSACTKDE